MKAYAVLPFDLVPDVIPVLGALDDLIVLPLLIDLALRMIPPHVYREHHERIMTGGADVNSRRSA